MASSRTTTVLKQDIAECVACHKQVVGEMQVELDVSSMEAEPGTAAFSVDGKIIGMRVQHDCIGATLRSAASSVSSV